MEVPLQKKVTPKYQNEVIRSVYIILKLANILFMFLFLFGGHIDSVVIGGNSPLSAYIGFLGKITSVLFLIRLVMDNSY